MKIKIGDRVKSSFSGLFGIVIEIRNASEVYTIKTPAGDTFSAFFKDAILATDNCFKKLRNLSGKSILSGNLCEDEMEKYVKRFGLFAEPSLSEVLKMCDDEPNWLTWLISNGYIKRTPGFIVTKGDRYIIDGETYILGLVDTQKYKWHYSLISLKDGNRWSCPVIVNGPKVTGEDFDKICGTRDMESVYKTRISVYS